MEISKKSRLYKIYEYGGFNDWTDITVCKFYFSVITTLLLIIPLRIGIGTIIVIFLGYPLLQLAHIVWFWDISYLVLDHISIIGWTIYLFAIIALIFLVIMYILDDIIYDRNNYPRINKKHEKYCTIVRFTD